MAIPYDASTVGTDPESIGGEGTVGKNTRFVDTGSVSAGPAGKITIMNVTAGPLFSSVAISDRTPDKVRLFSYTAGQVIPGSELSATDLQTNMRTPSALAFGQTMRVTGWRSLVSGEQTTEVHDLLANTSCEFQISERVEAQVPLPLLLLGSQHFPIALTIEERQYFSVTVKFDPHRLRAAAESLREVKVSDEDMSAVLRRVQHLRRLSTVDGNLSLRSMLSDAFTKKERMSVFERELSEIEDSLRTFTRKDKTCLLWVILDGYLALPV